MPGHRACCFVAPHILRAIAGSELVTPEVRETAQKSLAATDSLTTNRNERVAAAAAAAAAVAAATAKPRARSHPQGFVPPHILKRVSESESVGPQARASAEQTLLSSQATKDTRTADEGLLVKIPPIRKLNRRIYDCKESEKLQENEARKEGSKRVQDRSVNNAFDGLGIVYDFYFSVFGRNSIDDKGMDLVGNVHYKPDDTPAGYDNAFWNGDQIAFGDGDGEIFHDFTESLDVLAHELTHGVTQHTAQLTYQDQPGALNESISDAFACMAEQWWFGQTAEEGDWLLGQGMLSMMRRGPALRSLKAPGSAYRNDPILGNDPQPAHMNAYSYSLEDDGGVHLNSGIPNHAFYLAATGLGGFAWDKAGRVWYKSLTDPTILPDCSFKQFADLTVKHALELHGADGANIVKSAWVAVGVLP